MAFIGVIVAHSDRFAASNMPGALLAVAACVVIFARIRHRRRQKDIPKIPLAPRTLPIVGNVAAVKVSPILQVLVGMPDNHPSGRHRSLHD